MKAANPARRHAAILPLCLLLAGTVQAQQGDAIANAVDPAPATATATPAPAPEANTPAIAPDAASVPPVSPSASLISLKAELGTGNNGNLKGDHVLRVVQRSTTGKMVAAKTALGVLGMFAGGAMPVTTFKKENLKGVDVETVPNPALASLAPALRSRMDAYFGMHPDALPGDPKDMRISAGEWMLVYQELGDDKTAYELRFSADVGVPARKVGFLKFEPSGIAMSCVPVPQVASLEEWQADDYALVRKAADAYVEECATAFDQALPRWFGQVTASR